MTYQIGHIVSAETRASISAAKMGQLPSAATRAKLSRSAKARAPITEATRARISAAAKARVMRDGPPPAATKGFKKKGHPRSETTKAKISAAHKALIENSPEHRDRLMAIFDEARPRGLDAMHANRIGKTLSAQWRANISANHPSYRPLPDDVAAIVARIAAETKLT